MVVHVRGRLPVGDEGGGLPVTDTAYIEGGKGQDNEKHDDIPEILVGPVRTEPGKDKECGHGYSGKNWRWKR